MHRTLEHLQLQAQAWGHASQIGEQLARTDFAGQFKGKPADMTVAILAGASLGIPPEQIGKSIYVVHGTPGLYGKAALAIAKANGYEVERVTYTAQEVAIKVTAPNGATFETSYTFSRAEREGLVKGNKLQYTTRPEKMLFWKCVGEAADQFFPHLLNGMPIKEDWEQSEPIKAQATRVNTPEIAEKAAARTANATDAVASILARGQNDAQQAHQDAGTAPVTPESTEQAATPQEATQPADITDAIELDDEGYPYPNTGNDDVDDNLFDVIARIKAAATMDDLMAIYTAEFSNYVGHAAGLLKVALTTRKNVIAGGAL